MTPVKYDYDPRSTLEFELYVIGIGKHEVLKNVLGSIIHKFDVSNLSRNQKTFECSASASIISVPFSALNFAELFNACPVS